MNRNETALRSFYFSSFMTTAISVSFIPLWLSSVGYSKTEIGLLYSVGPLLGIGSNLLWGVLSDKFQTMKKIFFIVLLGQFAAIYALLHTHSFSQVFPVLAAFFFFQAPVNPLADSLTMNTISHQPGKSYSSFRVWGSLGFAFSAVAVGNLLRSAPPQGTVYAALGTIGLTVFFAFLLQDRKGSAARISFKGVWNVVGSRSFLWFLTLIFLMSVAHRSNDNFLALYLDSLGASKQQIGLAWMVSAVSEVPIFFLLSKYGHRFKELPLLALASLVYAVRFALCSMAGGAFVIIFYQMMHSLSFGIFLFTAIRYIQGIVPDEFRATGQAVFAIVWQGLAGLTAGALGGVWFDLWGGRAVYAFASVTAAAAAIGFLITHIRGERIKIPAK